MAQKTYEVSDKVHDMLHNIDGTLLGFGSGNRVYVLSKDTAYETTYEMLTDCESMEEALNHPARYKAGKYECIQVASAIIDENKMNGIEAICTFDGIKYWWRWKQKQPRASLKKTIVYAQKLLKHIEEHPELYPEG